MNQEVQTSFRANKNAGSGHDELESPLEVAGHHLPTTEYAMAHGALSPRAVVDSQPTHS